MKKNEDIHIHKIPKNYCLLYDKKALKKIGIGS